VVQQSKRTEGVSFVLSLWLETAVGGSPTWRWKAHHVQSGEERYFRRLSEVLEFVAFCAKVEPPRVFSAGE
jgi:hypothetical protein